MVYTSPNEEKQSKCIILLPPCFNLTAGTLKLVVTIPLQMLFHMQRLGPM